MTKFFCVAVLALLTVAKAAPLERTFHLNEAEEPVEVAADAAVVAGAVKTHVLSHAVGNKRVELTIKKVAIKPHVPLVAATPVTPAPAHPHAHAHATHAPAHAHEHAHATHAPAHAHEHAHATHAPAHAHAHEHAHATHAPAHTHEHAHEHANAYGAAAPLAVVLDSSPILVDKDKITEILKKLLSGAINKVQAHREPLVVPPGGKPVAVIFSAAMHVVDLGTLQPLVSAQGAAVPPSYEPSHIKVDVAKPYTAPAAKPYAPAAKPYAPAETVVPESQPAYEVVEIPSPAEVYTVPVATPPPAVEEPLSEYVAPAEVEVAAVEAAAYPPAPPALVKKVKQVVVANDIY